MIFPVRNSLFNKLCLFSFFGNRNENALFPTKSKCSRHHSTLKSIRNILVLTYRIQIIHLLFFNTIANHCLLHKADKARVSTHTSTSSVSQKYMFVTFTILVFSVTENLRILENHLISGKRQNIFRVQLMNKMMAGPPWWPPRVILKQPTSKAWTLSDQNQNQCWQLCRSRIWGTLHTARSYPFIARWR